MTAAGRLEPLDWETYLAGEELAVRRHEYVCGYIYAMAGAQRQHNRIVRNVVVALAKRLEHSPCEPFSTDLKVRTRSEQGVSFYYPDVLVECGPHDPHSVYTDDPVVVVEVLSPSTRRIDVGEKKTSYLTIPTLASYVLVDSERPGVIVWRRVGGEFKREVFGELQAVIPFPEIGATLPLVEVYAKVEWNEASEEDDGEE